MLDSVFSKILMHPSFRTTLFIEDNFNNYVSRLFIDDENILLQAMCVKKVFVKKR